MNTLLNTVWKMRIWHDTHGQDMLEYALAAGFVATIAVAISPGVGSQISTVFSKVLIQLQGAGGSAQVAPTV